MRRFICILIGAIVISTLVAMPAAYALPSYRGYTGLVMIPTADALNKGDWNAGVFFEDVASETVNDFIANYGIARQFEIGFDRFRKNTDSSGQTLLNFKYEFLTESMSRPAVGAGVVDLTNDLETSVYVVASKTVGDCPKCWRGEYITPRIHVGFGGGMFQSLFAGASFWLGNRVGFTGEWDSSNVNVGARFRITPDWTVYGAGINLTDRTGSNTSPNNTASFGVGVSYNKFY